MTAHPSLPVWQNFKHDGWVMWDVFHVQLDVKRSREFPVIVPLDNLRPLLGVTDTEELAERVSKAVQDQVAKLKLWRFSSWQQLPPAASISCCWADRSTVRASLRPEAAVPRLVHQLQQAGWPPQHAAATAAALCRSRLQLLLVGQLPGLAELAHSRSSGSRGVPRRGSSPGSAEPRERLAVLQLGHRPSLQMLTLAAGKLPDVATARQAAVALLSVGLPQQAAESLASAAVQLMLSGAAANPIDVALAPPRKPEWVLLLQQATKVLSACQPGMEAARLTASAAELQLCLAGLQEFGRLVSGVHPCAVFNCLMALEAAASEYAASGADDAPRCYHAQRGRQAGRRHPTG
ncbi:hypothetical protein COO60DRAFT_1674389 [Scenedesmus sp. NREL 46B-D3]|nr:hypothetical protein COO60DRAFT_1674389 [Scenedesmus sp. NREL 46B-D3]